MTHTVQRFINHITLSLLLICSTHITKAETGYFGSYFIDSVNATSVFFNYAIISNAITNGNQSQILLCTPYWNPHHVYNNFPVGLWYEIGTTNKWTVYNERYTDSIPVNSAYNIIVPTAHGHTLKHKSPTTSSNSTEINDASCNGKPNALVYITHTYDTTVYDTSTTGVWYNSSTQRWNIYNENRKPMLLHSTFNVFVADSGTGHGFIHTAAASNSSGNFTRITHPLADGHPNAVIHITHNYSPPAGVTPVYDSIPLGVFYESATGKWCIYHQDNLSPIAVNAAYNVLIESATPSAIEEVGVNVTALSAFPNPAENKVTLHYTLANNADVAVKLYDLSGRMVADVYTGRDIAGSYSLHQDVSGLGAGMYYYVVTAGTQSTRTTIAIVKY